MTPATFKTRVALLIRALLSACVIVVSPFPTAAEPPEVIRVQGVISQLAGSAVVDGNYGFLVEIYDEASGGAALFARTVTSAVAAGAYSIPVIPTNPGDLTSALSGDGPRFVQITVVTNGAGQAIQPQVLLPRQQLTSVPYALESPEIDPEFSTGDVKLTFKTVADTGWVLFNDGAIGNANSNANSDASAVASDETHDLFVLLWLNVPTLAVQNSAGNVVTRGENAENDWNANKRLLLPKALGRALAVAGAGATLTSRALGQSLGEEAHVLTAAELAAHTHGVAGQSSGLGQVGGGDVPADPSHSGQPGTGWITTQNTPAGAPHNNMQPTLFLNVMIKL